LDQDQFTLIDRALESLTVFCYYYSRANEGHELYQTAREKLIVNNNDLLLGRLLTRHAWIKAEFGLETRSIEADLESSWNIFKELDLQREIAQILLARGFFETRIHIDYAAGLLEFERAFQIYQVLEDRFYMAILLGRIGYCHEDPSSNFDFTRQSLALAEETGNKYEEVRSQYNLGGNYLGMGDSISGEQILFQALETVKIIGLPGLDYFISNSLAFIGFLHGDLDQMKRYLPPQDDMVIGKVPLIIIAYTSATKALGAAVSGDLEMSEKLARRSLEFPSNEGAEILAHWALAMVYIDMDNLDEASHQLSIAYSKFNISLYPGGIIQPLPVAALILARYGRITRAVQVLSLAANHPSSQIGWMDLWSTGANMRSELEQRLGKIVFQEQWDQGKFLDLVETVTGLASELTGEI
jgi:tetratricopeptide (TPR) repeat protein